MAVIPRFDPIRYLVNRRFGAITEDGLIVPSLNATRSVRRVDASEENLAQRASYEDELRGLSPDELGERVKKARAEDRAEKQRELDEQEARRGFNLKSAFATEETWDYWVKASYWTCDEAVALLLRRDPTQVKWKTIEKLRTQSAFAQEFSKLRELVQRAIGVRQLAPNTVPGFFIAWAQRNRIDVPDSLLKAIEAHGDQIADWKTLFDSQQEVAENVRAENESLRQRIAELGAGNLTGGEKGLATRERESLLKLVIAMAVGGYGFNSSQGRSTTASEIAEDLHKLGIALHADTVRKYLVEAADLLPGDALEGDR